MRATLRYMLRACAMRYAPRAAVLIIFALCLLLLLPLPYVYATGYGAARYMRAISGTRRVTYARREARYVNTVQQE